MGALLAVMTTLAGAQVLAVLLIVMAVMGRLSRAPHGNDRLPWGVAIIYVAFLTMIGAWHGGVEGILDGLRKSWPILLAPAAFDLAQHLEPRSFRRIESMVTWSAAGVALVFLVRWGFLEPVATVKLRQAFHSNPGVSGMIFLPAALMLLVKRRPTPVEWLIWAVLAVSLWFLNVRATIIPWIAVSLLGVLCFADLRRRAMILLPVVLLLLAVTFFLHHREHWLGDPLQRWNLFDLENQSAVVHRLVIWSQVIAQFMEHPILGNGFNNFHIDLSIVDPKYHLYLVGGINPHCGYLMVLHATGVVGLFVLLGVIGFFFRQVAFPAGRLATDRWRVVAALLILAMMIAALADKMIFVTLVSIQTWLFVGVAMARPVQATEDDAPPAACGGTHAGGTRA